MRAFVVIASVRPLQTAPVTTLMHRFAKNAMLLSPIMHAIVEVAMFASSSEWLTRWRPCRLISALCARRYDHHCPWVGTCIGKYNYRMFHVFFVVIGLHATLCIILATEPRTDVAP